MVRQNKLRFKGLDRKAIRKEGMRPIPLMKADEPLPKYIEKLCSQNPNLTNPSENS